MERGRRYDADRTLLDNELFLTLYISWDKITVLHQMVMRYSVLDDPSDVMGRSQ